LEDEVLTVKEAARYLKVNEKTVYDLCHRPDFPSVRISERRIIIPFASLKRWLHQQAEDGGEGYSVAG